MQTFETFLFVVFAILSHHLSQANVIRCPRRIPNGGVTFHCTNRPGHRCTYTCNDAHFTNPEHLWIRCMDSGMWNVHINDLCTPKMQPRCPMEIPNGAISSNCNATIGTICSFSCHGGFVKPPSPVLLSCQLPGVWDAILSELCKPVTILHNGGVHTANIEILTSRTEALEDSLVMVETNSKLMEKRLADIIDELKNEVVILTLSIHDEKEQRHRMQRLLHDIREINQTYA